MSPRTDSSDIDRLVGRPPSWMRRWGLGIAALFVLLILLFLWLIRYPDVKEGSVFLQQQPPPVRLQPEVDLVIEDWLKEDGARVEKGEPVALLKAQADPNVLKRIEEELHGAIDMKGWDTLRTGSLRPALRGLLRAHELLQLASNQQALLADRLTALETQRQVLKKRSSLVRQQDSILVTEISLARDRWQRSQRLLEKNSISQLEVERLEAVYLRLQREQTALLAEMKRLEEERENLQLLELEWRSGQQEATQTARLNYRDALRKVENDLAAWWEAHQLYAPVSGIWRSAVHLPPPVRVPADGTVGYILPEGEAFQWKAVALFPVRDAGQLHAGQEARLRIEGIPYQQWGEVEASVVEVSDWVEDGKRRIVLDLPARPELITITGDTLPIRSEWTGTARIATEDRRLLQRLLDPIRAWSR